NLAKISKEVLITNYRELQKENKVLQESFEKCRRRFNKSEKDLYAAKEILKERGVSQPDDAISLWHSSNKIWASDLVHNRLFHHMGMNFRVQETLLNPKTILAVPCAIYANRHLD